MWYVAVTNATILRSIAACAELMIKAQPKSAAVFRTSEVSPSSLQLLLVLTAEAPETLEIRWMPRFAAFPLHPRRLVVL